MCPQGYICPDCTQQDTRDSGYLLESLFFPFSLNTIKMTKVFLLLCSLFASQTGFSLAHPTPTDSRLVIDHSVWHSILQKHVSEDGQVDYRGLQSDRAKLNQYLQMLAQNHPSKTWSKEEQMAFWINAYNAFTIALILDHSPLKSITDLDNGKVWDRKWIKIGEKIYSLNNIENDILRPQFQDARIHFAVNCAAASCPPLLNEAYTAANLNALLDHRTRAFINDQAYNKITPASVKLSKIFDWYAVDFGNLISFLNQYSRTKIQFNASVDYLNYDWSLNKQ